jgi:hypothetical protein
MFRLSHILGKIDEQYVGFFVGTPAHNALNDEDYDLAIDESSTFEAIDTL